MKISELCIRQPVLSIVLSLVLVVLGILGLQHLEIRFFPKLVLPIVKVSTVFNGASANLMESQVTTKLENALAGVNNVDYISSSSSSGHSSITIQFQLGTDIESEAAEVRDKVASEKQYLPLDAEPPIVSVGTNATPVIGIGFTDAHKTPGEIRDYVQGSVVPMLRQLPGVGYVSVMGASSYAMRVWLNAANMAARNITVSDIENSIIANNIYFPAGSFRGPTRNYAILSDTLLANAKDFSNIIVKQTGDGPIRLGDVSNVNLGYQSLYDYPMRIDGKEGIMLHVDPLQGTSPIVVAKEVRASVAALSAKMPPGMHATITFDNSSSLKSQIHDTFLAIGEAVILVILVIFLFLGSFRAAIIPIVTIPVSLISVFSIISLLGFSINVMSLLGLVLAIGLVVDDAIVMLENIHRHIEGGQSPLQAAYSGAKEISYAIVVMSLTLVAVYAPIGLVQGFTSGLFKEFAFTLAGAVIISGFVALTLTPMMCSRILLPANREGKWIHFTDRMFGNLSNGYKKLLALSLRFRYLVVLILVAVAVGGYFLLRTMPSTIIPADDNGRISISLTSPAGSTIKYTDENSQIIEKILRTVPAIKSFTTQVDSTTSLILVELKPWGQRKILSQDLILQLNKEMAKVPGVTAVASVPDIVDYGDQGTDITLNFMTSNNYKDLFGPIDKMMRQLVNYPGILSLKTNLKYNAQQYAITIDRDLAAAIGVNIKDIADTVQTMMSGLHVTNVQAGGRSYDVMVQMQLKDLMSFNSLNSIYVNATPVEDNSDSSTALDSNVSSNMIPLSSLITLKPKIGQGSLPHFNRLRAGDITAQVAPGYTESQVIDHLNSLLPGVLTSGVSSAFSGKASQFIQSSGNMQGIFILSFVFIYLVLSAQFGSFLDPFIILFAVPLSLVGALFALKLGGGTINLYSEIGLVTLVGLISKHGVLITQFINNLRKDGMDMSEAIIQGAVTRFRPVLMTTAAMVFGALPLALASGPGSVGRHDIGWTVVGGLIFGTFFSLIVVPVAYSFLGKFKRIKLVPRPSQEASA